MKKILSILILVTSISAQISFDDYFVNKSLRIDILHTGDRTSELISLKDLIEEPYWGGSKTQLIDELIYGNYFFKVLMLNQGE